MGMDGARKKTAEARAILKTVEGASMTDPAAIAAATSQIAKSVDRIIDALEEVLGGDNQEV